MQPLCCTLRFYLTKVQSLFVLVTNSLNDIVETWLMCPWLLKMSTQNFTLLPRLMLELRKALTTTGCRQLLQIDKNSSLQFVFVWSTLSFTPWMSDQRTFRPKKQKCVFVHQQFNMFSQHDLRPERIWSSSKANLSARPSNCASPTSNCRVGKILRNKFWGNLTVQKWFHWFVGERLICLNDRIVFRPNK